MRLYRFFVPSEWFEEEQVSIAGPLVHRMKDVLRLRPGQQVTLLDNSGWEYRVELKEVQGEQIVGRVMQRGLAQGESRTKITLYQSLLKGQAFEGVLQRCTEVGVVAFVPVVAGRCIISSLEDIGEKKVERWRRVITEAAEQSRRGRLPLLRPALMLRQAWREAGRAGLALVPWEEERSATLRSVLAHSDNPPFSISLFIGPEGGFTEEEIEEGKRYGAIPVTLGPRVLRAETAGVAAASAILYELGDMG